MPPQALIDLTNEWQLSDHVNFIKQRYDQNELFDIIKQHD